MRIGPTMLAALLSLVTTHAANAEERWLVSAGGGITRAVSDPQLELFGLGASGSAGFYRSLIPWLSLGTRFTASALGNSSAAPENATLANPGTGGLYTLTLSTRVRPFASSDVDARATGLWIEGGGGIARTGDLWRPTVEAGLGYGFNLGPVVVSPTLRFQQVIHRGDMHSNQDGRFASGGFEVTFNDGDDEPWVEGPVFISMVSSDADHDGLADVNDLCPYAPEDFDGFRDEDGCPEHDVDRDGFADADDGCPDEPETVNGVNDHDGCPDSGALEMVNGVIVVDERILFGFDSYRIRPEGLAKLRLLAMQASGRESWDGLIVEGHTDVRGTRRYNKKLSVLRARAVRSALRRFGLELPIEAIGRGETQPIDPKNHERNRRVEIRVNEEQRRVTAGAGARPMSLLDSGDTP